MTPERIRARTMTGYRGERLRLATTACTPFLMEAEGRLPKAAFATCHHEEAGGPTLLKLSISNSVKLGPILVTGQQPKSPRSAMYLMYKPGRNSPAFRGPAHTL